jgi:ribosomal 50S subunit-recycling heat shock protein
MLLPFLFKKMRLDLFLKASRLIVRRSLAQKFCDANLVKVNDAAAKSSREIKTGDEIEIKRHNRLTRIKVLQVPDKKQVSKTDAPNLYEIISDEKSEDDLFEEN